MTTNCVVGPLLSEALVGQVVLETYGHGVAVGPDSERAPIVAEWD